MAQSTLLVGPYDKFTTGDKSRIMGGIPTTLVKEVFTDTFPLRGTQDKIIARLFHIFYMELNTDDNLIALANCVTSHDHDELLNNILNKLALLQQKYEHSSITDIDSTDTSTGESD